MTYSDSALLNVGTTQVPIPIGKIGTEFEDQQFSLAIQNRGTVDTIVVTLVKSSGEAGMSIALSKDDQGLALDHISWEDIAGGILAISSSGSNLLQTILWSHVIELPKVEDTPLIATVPQKKEQFLQVKEFSTR